MLRLFSTVMLLVGLFPQLGLASTSCIAHRGDIENHLENSLAALHSAAEKIADNPGNELHGEQNGVEFDVHHTSDGRPILMHDSKLKRTAQTNPRGGSACRMDYHIAQLPLKLIQRNCQLNNGELIPTLDSVLETLIDKDLMLFIEFKDTPSIYTLNLLKAFRLNPNRKARFKVISFKTKALDAVRAFNPLKMVKLLHLLRWYASADTKYDGINIYYRFFDQKVLKKLQRLGKAYGVYTVDSETRWWKYESKGVNYITTNSQAHCLAWLDQARVDINNLELASK